MTADVKLFGGTSTSGPQIAAGGLNGLGSLTTIYQDTASTDSKILTDVSQQWIKFQGGSTAVANNTRGLFSDLQLKPGPPNVNTGVLAAQGPGDYGLKVTTPQSIVIPPIDGTLLGLPAGTMLNLGTLTSIDLNVALRDISIDVTHAAAIPLSPFASYPQTFDASTLGINITGTSDTLLNVVLKQDDIVTWFALGLALPTLKTTLAAQGINLITSQSFSGFTTSLGFGFSTPLPATTFSNSGAGLGTLEHILSPNKLRLTVPVNFAIPLSTLPAPLNTLVTGNLALNGKLISETNFTVVETPEPSTMVLAGLGVFAMLAVRRRKK